MAYLKSTGLNKVSFPVGHTIKTYKLSYRITTGLNYYSLSSTFATVTYSSPGGAMQITGITATQGNLLHIQGYGGSPYAGSDATYETMIGFLVDGEEHAQLTNYQETTYSFWNGHVGLIYTVPASFTNKTISLAANHQTGSSNTHRMTVFANRLPHTLWMLVSEIQQ